MTALPDRALLTRLGRRIRKLRDENRLHRRELAKRASLSERFLAQVELGRGNPSFLSLAQIARALGKAPADLVSGLDRGEVVALLGLRGAGKSAVGRALADRLQIPFVELDARVEEAAGLSLQEMFELHGETYYRRLEREALERALAAGEPMVLATSGGLVGSDEAFDLLKRRATTVWLKATPEDHWNRVVAQGDHRPMANDPLAMQRLRELLASREPLYATADHVVDTTARPVEALAAELAGRLAPGAPA